MEMDKLGKLISLGQSVCETRGRLNRKIYQALESKFCVSLS